MARTSYLRTSVGAAGKAVGALRPSRIPVWGLSRPSKSFYDLVSGPQETGAIETGAVEAQQHSDVKFATKRAEPIVQSSEAPNYLPEAPAHAQYKATIAPKPDFPGTLLPVSQPSTSIQHVTHGHLDETTQAARPSGMTPVISTVAKEPADAPRLNAHLPHAATIRETANPALDIAELRVRTADRRQSAQSVVDHHSDSQSRSSIPNVMPKYPTEIAASPQLQPPSTTSRPPKLADTQAAANQDATNFRETMPVLHGSARSSASSKPADIRPSGNAVHIGSVDIHIHASPSPIRPVVRQVMQSATPIASITRGFAASFGLSQA
jgi:hypothetical protein